MAPSRQQMPDGEPFHPDVDRQHRDDTWVTSFIAGFTELIRKIGGSDR